MVRLRVAHAAHNRQLPVVPLLSQALECGIQSELTIQGKHIAWRVGQFGPGVVIGVVGVGDHGVDAVVAAVQRENHQNAAALSEWSLLGFAHQVGPADSAGARHQTGRAQAGAGEQKLAAIQSSHDVRYSGVLTAAATSWTGLLTNGSRALTVRSDHAPTPIR